MRTSFLAQVTTRLLLCFMRVFVDSLLARFCDFRSLKLANAIDLALFLYRFRASIQILIGNMVIPSDPSFLDAFSLRSFQVLRMSIWLDILLLWISWIWVLMRQCLLCCSIGCCRFILFSAIVVVAGVFVMEVFFFKSGIFDLLL